MPIQITGDPHADEVLTDSPFALLVGMMLDQQYPMEHAFRGPAKVLDRFGSLEPAAIAAADPEEFKALCSTPPAIHRFPGSMAERLQTLAAIVEEQYDGHAERIWTEASSGADLLKRVMALPGFGRQKAQIFTALRGQAARRTPRRLGAGGGRLRARGLPLGGRRGRPGVAAEGARLQAGEEGGRRRRPRPRREPRSARRVTAASWKRPGPWQNDHCGS